MTASQADGSTLTADTLTVRRSQAPVYEAGTVVATEAHGGRLLKITSVVEAGDSVVYTYTQASLAEAFRKLEVSISGDLGPAELGSTIVTGDPDIEARWVTVPTEVQSSDLRKATLTNAVEVKYKSLALGTSLKASGSATFRLNPELKLRLDTPAGDILPSLEVGALINPNLSSSLTLTSEAGAPISGSAKKAFSFPAFTVPVAVGPVVWPLTITPVVEFSAGVNGSAKGKFSTTWTQSFNGNLGVARSLDGTYSTTATARASSGETVANVDNEFELAVTAPKVELKFMIYNAAGPSFDMGRKISLVGSQKIGGTPPTPGVEVTAEKTDEANANFKASLVVPNGIRLFSGFKFEYTPVSFELARASRALDPWFFPFPWLDLNVTTTGQSVSVGTRVQRQIACETGTCTVGLFCTPPQAVGEVENLVSRLVLQNTTAILDGVIGTWAPQTRQINIVENVGPREVTPPGAIVRYFSTGRIEYALTLDEAGNVASGTFIENVETSWNVDGSRIPCSSSGSYVGTRQ